MRDTQPLFQQTNFPALRRTRLETLQMNLGYLCNLACTHCHVAAGPRRTELMDRETMDVALAFIRRQSIGTLDVTGGSPEMNPHFEYLMREASALGTHLMDRCNPTIIEEPGYEWVPDLLAELQVEVVASLPCYTSDNVDQQRGKGVFEASIKALRKLNERGYGHPGSGLQLNLVYNPAGPTLPPPQEQLQADYKQFLGDEFGIVFNQLFTLANMPIKRFGSILLSRGQFSDYMALLHESHRAENARNVMCRSLVSVDYRGYVYDCDFNQMLDMPLGATNRPRTHLRDLLDTGFDGKPIAVADHCYGCTAGQGSSCGGALN
ncbi:arsenosugar biosynthesis radical SAM (seleno)protein ArsS [Spectribacter hydrogenoxidans]|uniref:Arsenosugar biosynthesis radical SAM protein ArsS n=1 Tax=Spectribacter hydrogenoxidans TaxID=3075608 RepID=A0ABU3BZP5_9GAMM|nr:arsenosugar biosynthesis radical SAM (seleno)protein ArsS [Salinisphaera sp. W335]MDT0634784.1 arsenosugar biosynthesis radical SAM protein ArsS [Salinisphaera sp. W335]